MPPEPKDNGRKKCDFSHFFFAVSKIVRIFVASFDGESVSFSSSNPLSVKTMKRHKPREGSRELGFLLFFFRSLTLKFDIMITEIDILRRGMNREFRVKINHGSQSTLVGWNGLVEHVGKIRAKWLVQEALLRGLDKYVWRSRKGFRVTFYGK